MTDSSQQRLLNLLSLVTALLAWSGAATILAGDDRPLHPSDQPHWAFQAVARPVVPAVKESSWPKGDLD